VGRPALTPSIATRIHGKAASKPFGDFRSAEAALRKGVNAP
jgi:hypothetical protein